MTFLSDPVLHEITNPSKRFQFGWLVKLSRGGVVRTFPMWFQYKINQIKVEIINSLNSKLKQQQKLENEDWVCIEISVVRSIEVKISLTSWLYDDKGC